MTPNNVVCRWPGRYRHSRRRQRPTSRAAHASAAPQDLSGPQCGQGPQAEEEHQEVVAASGAKEVGDEFPGEAVVEVADRGLRSTVTAALADWHMLLDHGSPLTVHELTLLLC